ncbi:hypothetical protein IU448_09920 [Nocardia flavorosea]|uniref:DUF7373 family lipoprotein n=1 Tax=Nocardia flavorosea TaxID=53429 RepID=UPI001895920C|nr:hypothetical protein [Nocardia flavorosea]MBF6349338.1 hypothetical protein [Nocardia flavorosea]
MAALILTVTAAVTTACGQAIVGHPGPGMSPAAVDKLDVGLYPTEPADFDMKIGTNVDVYSLEARRMLGYLISPYSVDPDLRYLWDTALLSGSSPPGPGTYPADLEPISEKNYFIAGAATIRANNSARNEKRTAISILNFPDADYARTAAAEYNAAIDHAVPGRQKIDIAGYSDAHAALSPSRNEGLLFAARGPFVVHASILAPPDQAEQMGDRMKRILDLQFSALDELTPTPPDDMLDLPIDPEGIMRITLPDEYPGSAAYNDMAGAYPPSAHLHMETDAGVTGDYTPYGVDLVARNGATVYRTGSMQQAFSLQTALTRAEKYDEELPNPPGLTDARCLMREFSGIQDSFSCVIVYDRYVAVIDAFGIGNAPSPELYQATAAQYAMLANSR